MERIGRNARNRKRFPSIEGLENRQLMSASAGPDVALVSATTTDSKGVTVTYDVEGAAAGKPIQFTVYRSADAALDPSDLVTGSAQVLPPAPGGGGGTLDSGGHPATDPGRHTVTLALPGGLPPNPMHPFVVVAAQTDPGSGQAAQAPSTASFQTHVIGVITHGGKQPDNWSRGGPPWERRMAAQLSAEGYDAVIPYNWVAVSGHAGSAVRQGPKVAADVLRAAAQFPPGDPVDVHFIGHSEGAVINSVAIQTLNKNGWPANLKAGYLKVTMLDPHAANNNIQAQQYSVSNGLLGLIARKEINAYQSRAKDPLPVVTPNVDDAEVFYQHTPVRLTFGSNAGVYNLWGQVPVQGQASYYDLTAPGISHAGKFGVQDWYRLNVVPTLGDGGTFVTAAAVSGAQQPVLTPSASGRRDRAQYAGEAAPGAVVHLFAEARSEHAMVPVGRTRAEADGSWTVTTRPLVPGQYRVTVVTSAPPRVPGHRRVSMRPTAWLNTLIIPPPVTGS